METTERTEEAGTGAEEAIAPWQMPLWGTPGIMALGREDIARLAVRLDGDMEAGRSDPLRMLALSKKAMELFSRLDRAARARLGLRIPPGDVHRAHGCEITERETGVRYDYSVCGDAEWESLNGRIEELSAQRKEREAFLRTVPDRRIGPGGACANPVFGAEGTELMPPLRTASLGYAVTVK